MRLALQLIFGIFSFDSKNMRWFNLKRIVISFFILPIFLLILFVNRLFLALDYIFFPGFKKIQIKNPVFIVAAPRSGTTFLYHSLCNNKEAFTFFKLWEIVFAPSIIQKYFYLFIFYLDRLIGSPIKKIILFIEQLLIGRISKIHLIGLDLPEEDEAILLWNLSTIYLNFFYSDSHFFDNLFEFDEMKDSKKKKQILNFYKKCILRHNFVFNRNSDKQFLSKNPALMSKVESLKVIFPDAKILNINRCISKTIPSTLELNHNLYALFTSRPTPIQVDERTILYLVKWYKMANDNLEKYFKDSYLKIDFKKMTSNSTEELKIIYQFLKLTAGKGIVELVQEVKTEHKSSNKYEVLSDERTSLILTEIPFMANYSEK